jgi:hypothetical protein
MINLKFYQTEFPLNLNRQNFRKSLRNLKVSCPSANYFPKSKNKKIADFWCLSISIPLFVLFFEYFWLLCNSFVNILLFSRKCSKFLDIFSGGHRKEHLRYGKSHLYDIFFVLMWPCFTIGPSLGPPQAQNYIDIQHTKQNLVPGCISYSNTNINVSPSSIPTKSQKLIYQGT